MSKKPKYWDSWKGQVLRAIALDNARTFAEIRDRCVFQQKTLYMVIGELMDRGVVRPDDTAGERTFWIVDDNLCRAYKAAVESSDEKIGQAETQREPPRGPIEWLGSWIEQDGEDASLDYHHFFLEGTRLHHVVDMLIRKAERSILIVNPFVDRTGLETALRDAAKERVEALLITRRPKDNEISRTEFHDTLKASGVQLYYSGQERGVHSKLVVVDDEVAVVSSMNFTETAEAAVSWETGIVTIDKDVVGSIVKSIAKLKGQEETERA